jgi:hypothetical protein
MINADNLHEAEQEALGHLAQMDLALATRLHQLVLNSDEPKEIIELTRAYQRASRCVRQTIMLRARLRQERERHLAGIKAYRGAVADLADDTPPDPVELRIDGRIGDLQEAGGRIVAAASPDLPRAERLDALDRIDAWIDQEVEDKDDDFGLQDLDDHVLELCAALDLPEDLGRKFRDLPRPPPEGDDDEGYAHAYTFEPQSRPERRDTG